MQQCCVCFDTIKNPKIVLHCNHPCCHTCVIKILLSPDLRPLCPICRKILKFTYTLEGVLQKILKRQKIETMVFLIQQIQTPFHIKQYNHLLLFLYKNLAHFNHFTEFFNSFTRTLKILVPHWAGARVWIDLFAPVQKNYEFSPFLKHFLIIG